MTAILVALFMVLAMGTGCAYLIYRKEKELYSLRKEVQRLRTDYDAVKSRGTELEDDLRKTLDQIHMMISKFV